MTTNDQKERVRNGWLDAFVCAAFVVPGGADSIFAESTPGHGVRFWLCLLPVLLAVNGPAILRVLRKRSAAPMARLLGAFLVACITLNSYELGMMFPQVFWGFLVFAVHCLVAASLQLLAVPFSRVEPSGWAWRADVRLLIHGASCAAAIAGAVQAVAAARRSGGSISTPDLLLGHWVLGASFFALAVYLSARWTAWDRRRVVLVRCRSLVVLSLAAFWLPHVLDAFGNASVGSASSSQGETWFIAIALLGAIEGAGTPSGRDLGDPSASVTHAAVAAEP